MDSRDSWLLSLIAGSALFSRLWPVRMLRNTVLLAIGGRMLWKYLKGSRDSESGAFPAMDESKRAAQHFRRSTRPFAGWREALKARM